MRARTAWMILGALTATWFFAACGNDKLDATPPADGDRAESEAEPENESAWPFAYTAPDQAGSYRIGARAASFAAEAGSTRTLTGTLWYPTEASTGDKYYYQSIFLRKNLLGNAPIASGGPFPIVVFSHGHQAFAEQSGYLTEFLASHGFVVAAANHTGDTTGSPTDELWKIAELRPHDLIQVIDQLTAWNADSQSPYYGKLDLARIAVAGHSFGGYTALAISGASVDPAHADAACGVAEPSSFCKILGTGAATQMSAAPALADARVKVCVAQAPGGWDPFGAEGLAKIAVPTMIQHGDLDKTLPIAEEADRIFPALTTSPTYYMRLKGAGHFTFSMMCELFKNYGDGCGEGYIETQRAYHLINTLTLAFIRANLYGEARDASFLSADYAATIPELDTSR